MRTSMSDLKVASCLDFLSQSFSFTSWLSLSPLISFSLCVTFGASSPVLSDVFRSREVVKPADAYLQAQVLGGLDRIA